jgi:hypothetical protein
MQQILIIALSAAATAIGALVLWNLKSLKGDMENIGKRVERHDEDLRTIEQKIAACKIDCDRSNVSKEDWVRSEGYTRQEIKGIGAVLNRIEGKICIIEKLPEIIGNTVQASISLSKGKN